MVPLKMVPSLVLGETITQQPSRFPTHHPLDNDADADEENSASLSDDENYGDNEDDHHHHHHHRRRRSIRRRRRGTTTTTSSRRRGTSRTPATIVEAGNRTPFLLFTPTRELIQDTYRLAAIARDIGMDLYPNSSLSHIIFSWPPSPIVIQPTHRSPHASTLSASASTSTLSSSSYRPSFSSSTTPTSSPPLPLCSLPNDAIPLPFPTLTLASISFLRYFVSLSKGLFKLVFVEGDFFQPEVDDRFSSWDCSSLSLVSRATGCRVETMDDFSRVLAGHGWTMFKTAASKKEGEESYRTKSAYLFRRVDPKRIRARERNVTGRNCSRVRELRLPPLDFNNVPLRILQYIVLMTEDVFILT